MPFSLPISQLSFGGNAVNNPANYTWNDYSNYPGLDLTKSYVRMNIVFFDSKLGANLEVTGLIVLNEQGFPLMSPNDLAFVPCPPKC